MNHFSWLQASDSEQIPGRFADAGPLPALCYVAIGTLHRIYMYRGNKHSGHGESTHLISPQLAGVHFFRLCDCLAVMTQWLSRFGLGPLKVLEEGFNRSPAE